MESNEQQQSPSNDGKRKPWYRAIDFEELAAQATEEQKRLYADAEKLESTDRKMLKSKLAETAHELLTLAKGRGKGKDVRVTCPNPACGSKNRRCFIELSTGMFHCWVCGLSGRLKELCFEDHHHSGSADSAYYAQARNAKTRKADYVPMLPSDYKSVDIAVMTCLYPIFPLTEEQMAAFCQKFHPANATTRNRKSRPLLSQQQLLSLQGQAQRYCQAMGWTREVVEREGVMCAYISVRQDDGKSEDPHGAEMQPAIAYCNRLMGKIVNVKFRSVGQDPLTGQWSKHFFQESPTKPIAPYGIGSLCPLRPDAEPISQLVITEGEKDRLTLLSCGIPYALSIANGAETNIEESHEAFEEWIAQVDDIIVCGDSDRPGRTLVRRLLDHYPAKSRLALLPQGYKDISEVYAQFGAQVVRDIIAEAREVGMEEVYPIKTNEQQILDVMLGHYDHGYAIGMGPLTDHIFHPTSEGGLIIITGIPNSGKTDFLNCLTTHLMCHCQKRVAYFSFELPDKAKHIRNIARIALGEADLATPGNTADATHNQRWIDQALLPAIHFLGDHMFDFRLKDSSLPTPRLIIAEGDKLLKKHGLDYLVIDPYIFVNVSDGNERSTETEQVKRMLTEIQAWSRMHGVWTIIVAHPRIQHKDGSQADYSELDLYSIAGSAQWANLADYLFTVKRVNKPEEGKLYSVINMLKVRDQEFCRPGAVYYSRQACGRYDERESEGDCIAEAHGKVLPHDEGTWIE